MRFFFAQVTELIKWFWVFRLAFSVTLFCTEALVAILVLVFRRNPKIGGELGGPKKPKYLTAIFFFSLWIIYLVMSSLEAYGIIKGF